jgi:hypothetical protein
VIGNSYGWSSLALALANPGSQVVAIDAGFDRNSLEGLDVTNRMATRLGLDVTAVQAVSPQDVGELLARTLGQADLVFIDGYHSSEQILLDYRAVRPRLAERAVVLVHDVLFLDLTPGFRDIVTESGWAGSLLHGTTTGIALLAEELDAPLRRLVTAFAGHDDARAVVEVQARESSQLRGVEQREDAVRSIVPLDQQTSSVS